MPKVVAIDTGIGWEHARAFAEKGWDVVIHRPTISSSFPILKYVIQGYGFEGIRIGDLWTELMRPDGVDLVMILDLPTGRLGDYLRQELNIPCVGGGIAERLELDRVWAKRMAQKYGIPVPKSYVVRGIDNLKELMHRLGSGVIKIDTFRGDFETRLANSPEEAEQVIASIYQSFGPYVNVVRFIVEEIIPDSVLIGGDWLFDGKRFSSPYHFSLEVRPHCIGKWVEESVPILDEVKEKTERMLADLGYRGFYSNELLYNPDTGRGYLIDQNIRPPYPLSLHFPAVIKNYTDLVYACGKGDFGDMKVEVDHPFVGIVAVCASAEDKAWFPVEIKDKDVRIRWRSAIKIGGIPYLVPTDNIAGVVVGVGNTVDELLDDMVRQFEKVDFSRKEDFTTEKFDDAKTFLKKVKLA
jgi:hypothetical protein